MGRPGETNRGRNPSVMMRLLFSLQSYTRPTSASLLIRLNSLGTVVTGTSVSEDTMKSINGVLIGASL